MHDRLVSRRIDALHQCFLVGEYMCISPSSTGRFIGLYHANTCLRAYADSKGPDQPAHPRSLIWPFTVR